MTLDQQIQEDVWGKFADVIGVEGVQEFHDLLFRADWLRGEVCQRRDAMVTHLMRTLKARNVAKAWEGTL